MGREELEGVVLVWSGRCRSVLATVIVSDAAVELSAGELAAGIGQESWGK